MLRTIFQSELMTRLFFGSLLHKSVIYCGINILLRYFWLPAHSCGQPHKPTIFVILSFLLLFHSHSSTVRMFLVFHGIIISQSKLSNTVPILDAL